MYTQVNYLPKDRNWTLDEVNNEQVKLLIPSIIYTGILMVIGTIGNAIVLFIYFSRFKPSIYRCFILTLGVCDFVTCAVAMPFLIADMLNPYMFTHVFVCKTFRLVTYWMSLMSIFTLVWVAVERHRKICRPLATQITMTHGLRIILLSTVSCGFVTALPSFFMYGYNTVYTGVGNIYGVQCFTADNVKATAFPLVYNLFLLVMIVILGSGVIYCYTKVAISWYIRTKSRKATVLKYTRYNIRSLMKEELSDNITLRETSFVLNQDSIMELSLIRPRGAQIDGESNSCAHDIEAGLRTVYQSNGTQNSKRFQNDESDISVRDNTTDTKTVKVTLGLPGDTEDNNRCDATDIRHSDSINSGHYLNTLDWKIKNSILSDNSTTDVSNCLSSTAETISNGSANSGRRYKEGRRRRTSRKKRFVKRCATTSARTSDWRERTTMKITKMLLLITFVYALSFIPHLVLMLAQFFDKDFINSLNPTEASVFHLVLRSFLINAVANPFVYGYMDTKFKKECASLLAGVSV